MGTTALSAEVSKILEHLGNADLILVLCFLGIIVWITRRAFRNGQPVEVKVTLHSIEYRIGVKEDNKLDALPRKGAELDLDLAVESEVEVTEHVVDDDEDEDEDQEA